LAARKTANAMKSRWSRGFGWSRGFSR